MRKLTSFILFAVCLILLIPALALFGGNGAEPAPNPLFNQQSPQDNPLSKTDLEDNNFYLVKDAVTNEVMKLKPSDYIKGVVAAEMPIEFHAEALKAQAVAAHTYALRQIDEQLKNPDPELNGAYLSTDYTKFQAYISTADLKIKWGKDFDLNYKKLSDCVGGVIDEVLTYENAPIAAAFHSISGGKTESAKNVWGQDISYLLPVESTGDELSPSYENIKTLTDQEVAFALSQKYPEIKFPKDRANWFELLKRSDSNTITEMKVGSVTTTGKEIRELLKLKSANFSVDYKEPNFTFTTSGYGHGVGMSQYGADYMARQGSDYKQILLHYYSGVSLERIKA